MCSKRFRDLAMAHGFTGVAFVPLGNGYFVPKVTRVVDYDLSMAEIFQEGWCPECRNHRRSLKRGDGCPIAPEEARIGDFQVVQSRIRRSVELASDPAVAQNPDLVVGDGAARAIEAERFREIGCLPLGRSLVAGRR